MNLATKIKGITTSLFAAPGPMSENEFYSSESRIQLFVLAQISERDNYVLKFCTGGIINRQGNYVNRRF